MYACLYNSNYDSRHIFKQTARINERLVDVDLKLVVWIHNCGNNAIPYLTTILFHHYNNEHDDNSVDKTAIKRYIISSSFLYSQMKISSALHTRNI